MSPTCAIQPAAVGHAEAIVAAVREGFDARLLDLFIYGCDGIAAYVSEEIAAQDRGGDVHFTVAVADGRLAACAEMKRLPQSLFLNYIAVRPAFRSRGLAKQLLREAIALAGADGRRDMNLDVLVHNSLPRMWYERLGFRAEGTTAWWTMPLEPGDASQVLLKGYPQSQACQREYGFSAFSVVAAGREYPVGRLGARWFRLTGPETVHAPGLLAALSQMDPARRALLLLPDPSSPPSAQAQLAARTCRMVIDLHALRTRLAGA